MEEQIYSKLFNTIPLYSENHIDILINTMNKETALYYLIHAVNLAYHNGMYNLGESEVISKSIRILNKNEEIEPETE